MFRVVAALFTAAFVSTAAPAADTVQLHSGDTNSGEIIDSTDEHILIEHDVLGTLEIPRDAIAVMPELPADDTGDGDADAAEDAEADAVEQDKPSKWKSRIELGTSGSYGNSEILDVRIGFETRHETKAHRVRFDASYNYGQSEGDTNRSQGTAGVLHDWLKPDSPWLVFAQARYNFDEFRDWTHRISGHAGAGYDFYDTEDFQLTGRIGLGGSKQWKETEPLRPEGLIGGELAWNVSDRQTITAHTTLFPDLDDFMEYRIVSGVRWNLLIDNARGLALSAGVDNEYESVTEDDTKHNDFKFFAGISYDF